MSFAGLKTAVLKISKFCMKNDEDNPNDLAAIVSENNSRYIVCKIQNRI